MKIAFIHNHRAFLPELNAYQRFFQLQNIQTCIAKPGEEEISEADVLWYFMGFHTKSNRFKLIIHEYASASVPPFRKIKDFLKKISKTPMPQPLEYLITDVAKRHGKLRVGNTTAYLRCEDEGLIQEILHDRRLDHLRMRKLAMTRSYSPGRVQRRP